MDVRLVRLWNKVEQRDWMKGVKDVHLVRLWNKVEQRKEMKGVMDASEAH